MYNNILVAIDQDDLTQNDNLPRVAAVVASHRPDASDDLLATTAARSLRHASCSTLVVRQSGGSSND